MTPLEKPILFDGRVYPAGTEIEIDSTARARAEKDYVRRTTRTAIERAVGDAGTREGVLSDTLAILLVGLSEAVERLAAAKTVEQVREGVAPLEPLAKAIAAARKAGLTFPFEAKGADASAVVADLAAVSAGVAAELSRGA